MTRQGTLADAVKGTAIWVGAWTVVVLVVTFAARLVWDVVQWVAS